jgi:hypothetical protein
MLLQSGAFCTNAYAFNNNKTGKNEETESEHFLAICVGTLGTPYFRSSGAIGAADTYGAGCPGALSLRVRLCLIISIKSNPLCVPPKNYSICLRLAV